MSYTTFQVSVIMPVYNAATYVEQAIQSVFEQEEVNELVVINDGSTDNTAELLGVLAQSHPKLKIFEHHHGVNKGRSASRNLGIRKATSDYIAFLDADDYYLPGRFEKDRAILQDQPHVDGVYNAIGSDYDIRVSDEEKQKWQLISLWDKVPPESLFQSMTPIGNKGFFSGDGLTVRKTVFDKIGYFNESLEVAEDTELYIKMALCCRLEAGEIKTPKAMRRVHESNVFRGHNQLYLTNTNRMYASLLRWFLINKVPNEKLFLLWKSLWRYRNKTYGWGSNIIYWIKLMVSNPGLLFYKKAYKPLFF